MKVVPLHPDRFDLSGRWRVIHRVERSALSRYVGLEIEFDVVLAHEGDRVTGDGVHLSILEMPPADPEREIVGEIAWKVVTNDMLNGTFWVTAAKSAGTSR